MKINNNSKSKGVVIVKQENINDDLKNKECRLTPKFFHQ